MTTFYCSVGPPIPFRVSPEVKTKIIRTAVACKAGIHYEQGLCNKTDSLNTRTYLPSIPEAGQTYSLS